jgi:hypothetical protein
MDSRKMKTDDPRSSQTQPWLLATLMLFNATLFTIPALANSQQVPWECSNYSGEVQTRCLNGFIEQQREQINQLQGQLQAQQEAVGQLKGQVNQQTAATAALQQQLSQRLTTAIVPAPYAYSHVYPPVGLGIYLGRPWIYGAYYYPYYYGYGRHFWGPRYHDHRGRH